MNNLISKIVGVCLGLSLATGVGVGVAVGSQDKQIAPAYATTTTFTGTSSGGITTTRGSQTGTKDDVTLTIGDGLRSGDQIRIYKNATITISVPTSYTISSVTFVCTASGTAQYGPGCFGSVAGYSYSGDTGTWSGSAESVSLTASSNQVRATSIAVIYTAPSSKTLTGIAVSGSFTKTSYSSFDEWNPAGLTVTASYSDSTSDDVTSDSTWTFDPALPNDDDIDSVVATAHYGGFTADSSAQQVTVTLEKGSLPTYPYSVAEARNAITNNTHVNNVYTQGILVEVTYYNSSYNTLSYKISDDGTDSNVLEIYSGKGLDGAKFNSKDDLTIGSTLVILGNLTLYNQTTYQYSMNSMITSITLPSLSSITGIDGSLSAFVGDSSWDLSGLTPLGTIGISNEEVDISDYVDLSIAAGEVPGSTAGSRTVYVTVTPKDSSLSTLTTQIGVSATVSEVPQEATHTYASTDSLIVEIKNANNDTVATATMDKASGSTAPQFTSDEYRLYAKGYVYIRPAVNFELVSVKAVFVANANKNGVKPTPKYYYGVDVATPTCSTTLTSNTAYDCEDAELFAIYADGTAGNLGFTSITVGYKASASTAEITSITTTGTLIKTTQYVGQPFDYTGLSFVANYDNGSSIDISGSSITWNALAVGNSVSGTYDETSLTVSGVSVLSNTNINEIIFTNNNSTDKTTPFSDLDTHSKLGTLAFSDANYAYNGADSTLKLGNGDYGGSITLTSSSTGKYIQKAIIIAKYYGEDNTVLKVSGTNLEPTAELTSDYDSYEFNVAADKTLSITLSTPAKKQRCYIHSITLILGEDGQNQLEVWCQDFLDNYTCDANGNTAPSTSDWDDFGLAFLDLSSELIADAVSADADESGTVIEQAMAKYDYIIAKYGNLENGQGGKLYDNFIGRTVTPLSNVINPLVNVDNNAAIYALVAISMVTMTVVGAYFFLRKKKEVK